MGNKWAVRILLECILVTARKNKIWGKVIFLHLFVILFTGGGSDSGGVWFRGCLFPGGVWSQWGPPSLHPRGKLRGIRSRPTPKGEIKGDQIQAHTQGEIEGGSDPGPHPRWKLRGIRSRPTSKREIQGDQDQPPRRLLLWAVRILLECILVSKIKSQAI